MEIGNVWLTGEVTGKDVTGTVKVSKKIKTTPITFKKVLLPQTYILFCDVKVVSLFNKWVASGGEDKLFKLYFG